MSKKYYPRRAVSRWGSNIDEFKLEGSVNANTKFYISHVLCTNPAQDSGMINQQFTVKNIELQFRVESGVGSYQYFDDITLYIMYVPQGMTVTVDYPKQHPEYIMAYRFLGGVEEDTKVVTKNPLSVKSRLARRLQTGDCIALLAVGDHNGTNNDAIGIKGIVRWWTKSN